MLWSRETDMTKISLTKMIYQFYCSYSYEISWLRKRRSKLHIWWSRREPGADMFGDSPDSARAYFISPYCSYHVAPRIMSLLKLLVGLTLTQLSLMHPQSFGQCKERRLHEKLQVLQSDLHRHFICGIICIGAIWLHTWCKFQVD